MKNRSNTTNEDPVLHAPRGTRYIPIKIVVDNPRIKVSFIERTTQSSGKTTIQIILGVDV